MAAAQSPSQLPKPLVISRVELVFSVVSHHAHISDRVAFFNEEGVPKGNSNYAVPMLVCDPIVTLYNPTIAPVTKQRARVVINDPPVGFRFKKNAAYVREEFANGEFHGISRFQIHNEKNPAARKSFTLLLRELTASNQPGKAITLQPGEAKQFSAWTEQNWTWGLETTGGFTARQFHDWNKDQNLSNRDGRTSNLFGVEGMAGWDVRAGFQYEHLSYMVRPNATRYDFEITNHWDGGWMGIKLSDTFSVEARPQRVVSGALPDYSVDLLAGLLEDKARDFPKAYPISLDHLKVHNSQNPAVSRAFLVGDILQTATDLTPGGKTPFAMLTMVAKSQALVENRFHEEPPLPTEELYEFDWREISDFSDLRRFFGPSDAPLLGSFSVMKTTRNGDAFALDLATGWIPASSYRVMGTGSLEAGFTEDISSRSTFVPGPQYSGIGKMVIDVSGLGDRYFVRVEELD